MNGGDFAVFEKGIYFIRPGVQDRAATIDLLSFDTGTVRTVASLPHLVLYRGLSVSPDGRFVLYTQEDQVSGSDLMLVENFR